MMHIPYAFLSDIDTLNLLCVVLTVIFRILLEIMQYRIKF